ncbi:hemerythrin domain-containing protein [Terricaulis sp.]|uniref:hemerythrin domain-containing protein n=1 Tax=Terricaulis sp. TaxID=2768686 RepID=UPI003782DA6D
MIFGNANLARPGHGAGLPETDALRTSAWISRDPHAPPPEEAVDFILFEHLRHREMCTALERMAAAPAADAVEAAKLAQFIRHDLTLHILDEEELFFPLLRERCLPEDEIDAALQRMNREHAEDRELSAQVRLILLSIATEAKAPASIKGGAEALRRFAQNQRRHMMLENAVLIPLARRRLTGGDLAALGQRLAARRRLESPTSHR